MVEEIKGGNMDIDLVSKKEDINWKQDKCPWNIAEKTNKHRCAVKNISICSYFKGIKAPDIVLCAYSEK
jgi:hypothetical protein